MSVISPPEQSQTGTRETSGTGIPFWEAARLVATREVAVRLRDKVFLFTTASFMLIAILAIVVPPLLAGGPSSVAVASPDLAAELRKTDLEVRTAADAGAAARMVRDGEVDAAVIPHDGPAGVTVLALDEAPRDVMQALSVAPPVKLLDPDAVDPVMRFMVPMAFAMVFFFTSISFGVQIAQSITEEKQTRIIEILVATVPVRALLTGKLLGNGVLAMGQILLTAVVSLVGMSLLDTGPLLSLVAPAIGWFIPFFLAGFTLLAAMWAVSGALASRLEDVNATSAPVQLVVMLPFFGVIFFSDRPVVMAVLSYLPFSAPTAMPVRLFFGDAAPWEPALALAVLLASAVLFVLLSSRLYRGSLLQNRGRTSLGTAWRRAG